MPREGIEKRKPSYTVGRNVIWCSHAGKQYGGFSKKLKTELLYDPIPSHSWHIYTCVCVCVNQNLKVTLYSHVHCSIIHNS